MKNNIPTLQTYIMNTFNLTKDDIYSSRIFPSKEITNKETGEITQSGSMKAFTIKGLVKNHTISFKLFEKASYAQIVKYNRETKKQNFINFDKKILDSDLLQLQSFVAQRTNKPSYNVEDFVA